jgi:2-oxoglutarate ferredoxin oxidoreductase subunit beta
MTTEQGTAVGRTREHPLKHYLRDGSLPHFFCAGCGSAQVLNFFLKAANDIQLDFDQLVAIGGVGCTARVPVYIRAESLHGVHGRTLPWATGIKLHNPDLKVVIFSGDGDAAAIGGNHLIQAARRNLDVTMIVANNLNFAMTGGQVAPTTMPKTTTTTTPYGNVEPRFDLCKLVAAAGGTYVARTTTYRPVAAINAIKKGLQHKGFAFVEVITQCPTNYGRRAIGTDVPAETIKWIQGNSVPLSKADQYSQEELESKFVIGTFADEQRPVFRGSSYYFPEEQE